MLYADGGNGKSVLSTYAAVAVAAGLPFLGVPTTQSSVIYIDFECTRDDTREITGRICNGLGIPIPRTLKYLPAREDGNELTELLAWLPAIVLDGGYGFVILDSLSIALETEPQEARPVMKALKSTNWLKAANCAMLVLDHQSKNLGDDTYAGKTPLGTVAKRNLCRQAWQLEKRPMEYILRDKKENFQALKDDLHFKIDYSNDVGPIIFSVTPTEELATDKEARAVTYRMVLACVNEHLDGVSNTDIIATTGLEEPRVNVILSRLGKQKQIKHLGRGLWAPK